MNKAKKYAAKIRYINKKRKEITDRRPEINFNDFGVIHDIILYQQLTKELIYAEVDLKFCKSTDLKKVCSSCNCWKNTVHNEHL